jgi:hypothetical protein
MVDYFVQSFPSQFHRALLAQTKKEAGLVLLFLWFTYL